MYVSTAIPWLTDHVSVWPEWLYERKRNFSARFGSCLNICLRYCLLSLTNVKCVKYNAAKIVLNVTCHKKWAVSIRDCHHHRASNRWCNLYNGCSLTRIVRSGQDRNEKCQTCQRCSFRSQAANGKDCTLASLIHNTLSDILAMGTVQCRLNLLCFLFFYLPYLPWLSFISFYVLSYHNKEFMFYPWRDEGVQDQPSAKLMLAAGYAVQDEMH